MRLCILFFLLFFGAILSASPVADPLFAEARAALKARDFETAIARLDTLIKREPDPMPPEIAKAWAAVRTARAEAALRHARGTSTHAYDDASRALQWDSASGVAYAVRAILRGNESGNRAGGHVLVPAMSGEDATQKAAMADLDMALKHAPDALLTHIALGSLKWAEGDRETSFTALETAYLFYDNDEWAERLLDRMARRSGGDQNLRLRIFNRRSAEARARMNANPYDDEALHELASLCREIDAAQAKTYWTQLIAAHPDNVAVLCRGAYVLFPETGDKRQAREDRIRHLLAALEKYDGRGGKESIAAAAMSLGWMQSEARNYEQARKNFAMAVKFHPDLKESAERAMAQIDAEIAAEKARKAAEAELEWKRGQKARDIAKIKELNEQQDERDRQRRAERHREVDRINAANDEKTRAAIAAYDRVHPRIERLAARITELAGQVQRSGVFSNFETSRRGAINRLQREMVDEFYKFKAAHGQYLPRALMDHLNSDVRGASSVRNSWVDGSVSYDSGEYY